MKMLCLKQGAKADTSTHADPSHDAVLQVRQVLGKIARLEVVENQGNFAAMLHGRVSNGYVTDPIVGRQATQVDERSQFRVTTARLLVLSGGAPSQ